MAYLDADNWEHCQEFIDYLFYLHQQEMQASPSPNQTSTRLQELNRMCQNIPGRTYRSYVSSFFYPVPDPLSNSEFVAQVSEWMNEPDFMQNQKVKHQKPVRFGEEYAPNLAYAFEYFIQKRKSDKPAFSLMDMDWLMRMVFQPRWQKAFFIALMLTLSVLSVLSMGGILPIGFLAFMGISSGFMVAGGIAMNIESTENNGLFQQRKSVIGARDIDFKKSHEFRYAKHEPKAPSPSVSGPLFSAQNTPENSPQSNEPSSPPDPLKIRPGGKS